MVQAFEADSGDGVQESQNENAHASLIGEVMDFVKENPTVSTIAAIGVAAGSIYLARAPIGRFLSRAGGSVVAVEETLGVVTKVGKPLGRQLAAAGDDAIVTVANIEKTVAAGVKSEGVVTTAVKAEDAIVSGTKVTDGSKRPLLDALDDAVKTGKAKTPEPWVYHPENRTLLKDLPKGGATDIKPAGDAVESVGTVGSTHSPEAKDIVRIAFPGSAKQPVIDVNKHRFLRNK